MAAGDNVVQFGVPSPPTTVGATPDQRTGGSTPAESITVWDFDAAQTEYIDIPISLTNQYDGGGLTFRLVYMMSSATSGGISLAAAIRRLADDVEDFDGAHTYDFNLSTETVPNVAGEWGYIEIAFTDGADMDSLAASESGILRIMRDHDDAGDTATGDLELLVDLITCKETA